MNDEKKVNAVDNGGHKPPTARERLNRLYDEAQALKMSSLRKFLKISGGEAQDADALKFAQMVLKAIEVQLRILTDVGKCEHRSDGPLEMEVILDAFGNDPHVKAFLGRKEIRSDLIAVLDQQAKGEN